METVPEMTTKNSWLRILRIVVIIVLALVLLGAIAFVVWAETGPNPMPEAVAALESTEEVSVSELNGHLLFEPTEARNVGFVFYPGGRVEPEAYAPYAKAIAQEGYTVAILSMPLNLALFGIDRADAVIEQSPETEHWVVGGHSLGGVAAARYAGNNPDIEGLVLLAAYSDQSLADRQQLEVLTLYGTADGLIEPEAIEAERGNLPEGAQTIPIDGGNHSQFGWYGLQSGDGQATISREEQAAQTVAATLALLEKLTE